ncbi:cobalamin-binding protein [uncultured Oxalicibacterium sp.]|uniref:cobalamin-binding protein n=1 Tax=uncultured Oxalicibacterium sp. TaxID=1168540 RepID=UPI0025DF0F40|nr:cobalamin-binding protein [uncultured Oxalicibacterium sp.]
MKFVLGLLVWAFALQAHATVSVVDDAGKTVTLPQPAKRVISLAPHATELIFAAGAGDRIVGTVGYSDYPAEALKIPRVGSHQQVDLERIIAMKPDLLVVWLHGNSERQLEHVRKLGIPFYFSEPKKLADIPSSVERMGILLGTSVQANRVAAEQRVRLAQLEKTYRNRPVVRMFYQVWGRPIYTLNGSNILSDAIRLCGGENIFANLSMPAPVVSTEAVLLENPEVMMMGDRQAEKSGGLEIWLPYKNLLAVKNGNLFSVDADLVNRAGPRLIDGTALVCEKLEEARKRRHP